MEESLITTDDRKRGDISTPGSSALAIGQAIAATPANYCVHPVAARPEQTLFANSEFLPLQQNAGISIFGEGSKPAFLDNLLRSTCSRTPIINGPY